LIAIGRARLWVAADGACGWGEPPPFRETDRWSGDPGLSSPLAEHDAAPPKERCDVLLTGAAQAPDGRAVSEIDVALTGAGIDKHLRVTGARTWQVGLFGVRAAVPAAFTQQPLDWSFAFGGAGHAANPAGRGWLPRAQRRAADGLAMPQIERRGEPVREPWSEAAPVGFGPVARSWAPRAALAGTYDAAWRRRRAPLLPDDFQAEWHQCAPEDQRIAIPDGPLTFTCRHLTPGGLWAVEVPAFGVDAWLHGRRAPAAAARMRIDTIELDPQGGAVELTWRARFALPAGMEDARTLAVGPLPHSWHRARALGKAWRPTTAPPVRSGA
jgi:hypothetical protein